MIDSPPVAKRQMGFRKSALGSARDIAVERVEAGPTHEQPVGTLADLDLPRGRVGLAALVERHHDHGGAVRAKGA